MQQILAGAVQASQHKNIDFRYITLTKDTNWIDQMNTLGKERIPFFFMLDFDLINPIIIPFDKFSTDIQFEVPNGTHTFPNSLSPDLLSFEALPISLQQYTNGFNIVLDHIKFGNSFLTNYTCRTPILTNYSLEQIFHTSEAKYKLLYRDRFVIFSPECFVTIKNGKIKSYPMKGTIDADIPNAEQIILNDKKELAEHYTIVDLIRNDLSQVSRQVHVPKFRYIDKITSNGKNLLQVSSEVEGTLPGHYLEQLGSIFNALLPAGSISGAPKVKTTEIIHEAEIHPRGMYTGVFGYFDGNHLDSGVAIRYIEQENDQFFYRSGGGITHQSNCHSEYQEMLDKIYVPISREYQNQQGENISARSS